MESTDSIMHSLVTLWFLWMALWIVLGAVSFLFFYHLRFLIDSVNNRALGSMRMIWLFFLIVAWPFADALYFRAVWSRKPNPKASRLRIKLEQDVGP